jgi:hypothetical protein
VNPEVGVQEMAEDHKNDGVTVTGEKAAFCHVINCHCHR